MSEMKPAIYFKFLARLYELAADFNQHQLIEIRRDATNKSNKLVFDVASLLIDLHENKVARSDSQSQNKTTAYKEEKVPEVLSSRKVFPSNTVLSEFARSIIDIPEKKKESRNRLVSRILRAIESSSSKDKASFQRALEEHIAKQTDASDFVSQWTKIIRDL